MSTESRRRPQLSWEPDTVGDLFYPVYTRVFGDDSDFVANIDTKLAEARMAYPAEMYISWALGVGLVVGVIAWLSGLGLGYLLSQAGVITDDPIIGLQLTDPQLVAFINAVKVPAIVLLLGVVLGTLGFGFVFGTSVAVPYLRAGERSREINRLLADAISFMYALSQGGVSQLDMIEAVADADDTYGELAREFETIIKATEYFETDYRTAIRQQAIETPSEELSQFLTDFLSVIDSGGDVTRFLNDKKKQHFRTAKQEEEQVLDTLELFGEIFITVSLFPLLLIIMLVVMQLLGNQVRLLLIATTYILLPFLGAAFIIIVAIVKIDDPGDGYLEHRSASAVEEGSSGLLDRGLVEQYVGDFYIFDRIRARTGTLETLELLSEPHVYFRENPTYTVALTVPAAAAIIGVAMVLGAVPTTWSGITDQAVAATVIYLYLPVFIVGTPLAVFYEWNVRRRQAVMDGLSDELRKLASANDTGMTLLESIRTVADTSRGRLADELGTVYAKTLYGMSVEDALIVFNNRYRIPRLARTVKLITEAQQASNQISSVLNTAAQAAENQDEIERERVSRTRIQVSIIVLTFLTLLGVMAILKARFIDVIARLTEQTGSGASAAGFGGGIDQAFLSLMFFHAVTLQAIVAGLASGYMRSSSLLAGMKYVVSLLSISLVVWLVVA